MAEDPIVDNLKATLFRAHCPTNQLLGEFELGLLEANLHQEIETHLEYCLHCRQTLVEIREFMELDPILDSQANRPTEQPKSIAEQAKIFVINLLSPPAGMPALKPAFRGQNDETDTRVFTTGPYLVSLSIEKDVSKLDHYNLIGDVSVVEETAEETLFQEWRAYLWQADSLIQTISLGDGGAFFFEGVELGGAPFELIIGGGTAEIHLQNIQVRQS